MSKSEENVSERRTTGSEEAMEKTPRVLALEDEAIEQDPGKVVNVSDGEMEAKGKAIKGPCREDIRLVIADILKEADLEVITLLDILRQLEIHFKVCLTDRKLEVRTITEEVLECMLDAEECEENETDGEDKSKGSVDDHEANAEDNIKGSIDYCEADKEKCID